MLGLISFAISIETAITAKASDVDLIDVIKLKENRKIEREF